MYFTVDKRCCDISSHNNISVNEDQQHILDLCLVEGGREREEESCDAAVDGGMTSWQSKQNRSSTEQLKDYEVEDEGDEEQFDLDTKWGDVYKVGTPSMGQTSPVVTTEWGCSQCLV